MKRFVVCFLFNKDMSKVLMIFKNKDRKMWADKYNGLGGKIEEGETIHDAVVREIWEESNEIVTLTQPKFITTSLFYNTTSSITPEVKAELNVFYDVVDEFENIENNEGQILWLPVQQVLDLKDEQLAGENIPYFIKLALAIHKQNI